MNERITSIFFLPADLYCEGSPVVLVSGTLMADSLNGKRFVKLSFLNLSSKLIRSIRVLLHPLDAEGRPVGEPVEKLYDGLVFKTNDLYGKQFSIPLTGPDAFGFSVDLEEILFSDGSSWSQNDGVLAPLPASMGLFMLLGDEQLVRQYRLKYGESSNFAPEEYLDLWRCACGAWAKGDRCPVCSREKRKLLPFDLEELIAERDTRLAKEKAEREKREAREKAEREEREAREKQEREWREAAKRETMEKAKKILKIAVPALILCLAVYLLVAKLLIPGSHYKAAKELLEEGRYEEAIEAFTELDGFRDSEELLQEAEDGRIEALNAAAYAEAVELMEAENYGGAIPILTSLGDYRDAPDLLEEAQKGQKYQGAVGYLQAQLYSEALLQFEELGDYRDSAEQVKEVKYQWAISLLAWGEGVNYDDVAYAHELFESIRPYKDTEEYLARFLYVRIRDELKERRETVTYSYDAYGRLMQTYWIDAYDKLAPYDITYDEQNNLTRWLDGDITLDDQRRVVGYSSGSSSYTFSYNDSDQVIRVDSVNAGKTSVYTFTYEVEDGRVVHFIKRGGSTYENFFSYDSEGRISEYRYGDLTVKLSYNGDGSVAEIVCEKVNKGRRETSTLIPEYGYIYAENPLPAEDYARITSQMRQREAFYGGLGMRTSFPYVLSFYT